LPQKSIYSTYRRGKFTEIDGFVEEKSKTRKEILLNFIKTHYLCVITK